MCRRDVVTFVNDWCWTFDPRIKDTPFLPFELWPRQVEYLRWLDELADGPTSGLSEKSRDSGVSWLNAVWCMHRWRFFDGFTGVFGANKEIKVDKLGDLNSILQKVRFAIDWLPRWMRPPGFDPSRHAGHMLIQNPDNGSTIVGEAGDNIGRGGRAFVVFIDEAAHLARGQLVNAATSATADMRVLCSSVRGYGNWFAETRHSGTVPVFPFGWQDDPRKSEAWAVAKEREVGAVTWAQEFNMDYGAALEGLVIPRKMVDAAIALWKRLPHPNHHDRFAGADIGAGKDLSVFQPRIGELVPNPTSRKEGDTTKTALWLLELCVEHQTHTLLFDTVAVGEGVKSTLTGGQEGVVQHVHPSGMATSIIPVNWGVAAPTSRHWPDGRTSAETFENLKAELWWIMRERFRRSLELLRYMDDEEGGYPHDPSDVILLEPHTELQAQLSTVRWFVSAKGKIQIESKQTLARRGIKSPDYADALALSYHETVRVLLSEAIIGAPTEASQMEW